MVLFYDNVESKKIGKNQLFFKLAAICERIFMQTTA